MNLYPRQVGEVGSGEEDASSASITEEQYWFRALEYGVYYPIIWGLIILVVILLVCSFFGWGCCIIYCRRQKDLLRIQRYVVPPENVIRHRVDCERVEDRNSESVGRQSNNESADQRSGQGSAEERVWLHEEGGSGTSMPVNPAAKPDCYVGMKDAFEQEPSNHEQSLKLTQTADKGAAVLEGAKRDTAAEVLVSDLPAAEPTPAASPACTQSKKHSSGTSDSPKTESDESPKSKKSEDQFHSLPASIHAGGKMAVSPRESKTLNWSLSGGNHQQSNLHTQDSPTPVNQSSEFPLASLRRHKKKKDFKSRPYSTETSRETTNTAVQQQRPTSENVEANVNGARPLEQKRPQSDNITSGTQRQETEHNSTSSLVGAKGQVAKMLRLE